MEEGVYIGNSGVESCYSVASMLLTNLDASLKILFEKLKNLFKNSSEKARFLDQSIHL
jgi:hypothetical protein